MQRIVVINPKGGSGKTMLATNLASFFSNQGKVTTLMDLDPQGSSVFWALNRPEQAPPHSVGRRSQLPSQCHPQLGYPAPQKHRSAGIGYACPSRPDQPDPPVKRGNRYFATGTVSRI